MGDRFRFVGLAHGQGVSLYHCFASLSHRKVTIEKQAALRDNIIIEILLSAGLLRLFARDEGCERMIRDGRKLQRRAIAFAAL